MWGRGTSPLQNLNHISLSWSFLGNPDTDVKERLEGRPGSDNSGGHRATVSGAWTPKGSGRRWGEQVQRQRQVMLSMMVADLDSQHSRGWSWHPAGHAADTAWVAETSLVSHGESGLMQEL